MLSRRKMCIRDSLYEGEYRDTGAFAAGGFNPASVEYIPQEEEEETQRVYTNLSFESDDIQGLSLVPKSNKITVEAEQGKQNHYLLYKREGKEDLYTETALSDVSSYVIVQADYKLPKGASMGITLQVKDADGKGHGLLKAAENINMAGTGTRAGSLSDSEWTNVAVAINMVRSTLSVYIDGVQTVKDQDIPDGRLSSLSLVRFYCDSGSAAAMLQDLSLIHILVQRGAFG